MSLSDPDHRAEVERKLNDQDSHEMAEHMGNVNEDTYEWAVGDNLYEMTDFTCRLSRNPVVPGSLVIVAGPLSGRKIWWKVTSDRSGNLVGDVAVPGGGITNCVNHLDGAVSLRFKRPICWLKATYHYRDDLRGTYA